AVIVSSSFDGSFFGLPDTPNFPGPMYVYLGIQAHVLEEGINATAPHTSYLYSPTVGNPIFGSFGMSAINETLGIVNVQLFGSTDIAACNQTMHQLAQVMIEKLTLLGLNFRESAESVQIVSFPVPMGGPVTVGYLVMTSLNDSVTAYNYIESLIPEGTLAKSVAQKNSNEKYITLFDTLYYYTYPTSWNTLVNVGMVLENQISMIGNTYIYNLGTLFEPDNKTIKGPVTIYVYPPVNSNVKGLKGLYSANFTGFIQPSFYYSSSFDVNADDFGITYTLESGVPYIVVNYEMSNWNMNPGENGTLYLTVRNVGSSKAFSISGSVYLYDTSVMYFPEGMPWPGMVSFYFDEIDVGQVRTLEYNVAASSMGITQFQIMYNWLRALNGLSSFSMYSTFTYDVGIPGPHIITSIQYSNWILNPNDIVSATYIIRNVGTETATNVTSLGPPIPPIIGRIINSSIPLMSVNETLVFLGDIPAGSSIAVNMTLEYDVPLVSSVHTGLGPINFANPILYNGGMSSYEIIQNPILMPGIRSPNAIYIVFEKTPEIVSVNPNDEVFVSVKVKNLGLSRQTIYASDLYPQDVFELISGSNIMMVDIESGSSATMTYRLRAKTSATLKLPPPTINALYSSILFGEKLLGTPLNKTTHNTAYVEGEFLINNIEEANVKISGTTPIPTTLNTWGNSPPQSANPPEGVIPLNYIRAESNESITATLVLHYTEDQLPAGVSEENLAVFQWDEQNMKWVELTAIVDTELNTVTVEVSSLSYFMLGAKELVEEVFSGWGMLQIGGKLYFGSGNLYLSGNTIKIEIGRQSASWNILDHSKLGNIDIYFGEGVLGKVTLIISRGETSIALAIGRGTLFLGSR
ncbi:MAG: hypothetical protein QW279_10660, partial [Candidatus Jordarchaeaceae archaeon]